MNASRTPRCRAVVLAAALLGVAGASQAHVTLAVPAANAGSEYRAAFRVGHACKDAAATTGLTVRVPAGFTVLQAQPRAGWTLASNAGEIRWQAETPQAALPNSERAQFVVRGKLPAQTGTLWFKVLQTCDVGHADWAQVPVDGAAARPEFPAARLDVVAGGAAPVEVSGAWVRQAVPGQSGTGAFMTLKAGESLRLVAVSTPVAGVADVHEMKMEGERMQMRALAQGLALPADQAVELKPGGFHVMLMDLQRELAAGERVPLTLRFVDAQGRASSVSIQAPVQAASGAGMHPHKH